MVTKQITFVVGNEAVQLKNDNEEQQCWKWRLFVQQQPQRDDDDDCDDDLLERVVIFLHPTYPKNVYELEKTGSKSFASVEFTGWGTFVVGVHLYLKQQQQQQKEQQSMTCHDESRQPIHLEYQLVFAKGRHETEYKVPVSFAEEIITPAQDRQSLMALLASKPHTRHSNAQVWHGRCYTGPNMTVPTRTWTSDLKPRDDHDETPDWLTASEYCDQPEVMRAKVKQLASLLRLSKRTVIYSGAGISSAAGIGTAARGARKSKNVSTTAQPTLTHYALAALAQAGYIQGGWLQQNHDGLPQKAGFPQEHINEIHGSWYDPSNPVVVYSGNLKEEQLEWMLEQTRTADLVLVLGTSLGGLNADRVAHEAASRSRHAKTYEEGGALGMVIVNLQQTEHDGKATLRIFGETDTVFSQLLQEMKIKMPHAPSTNTGKKIQQRVLVPYDKDGNRSESGVQMWWDLRKGAQVKLTAGHNVQGAGQPSYLHIRKGVGQVASWMDNTKGIYINIECASMCLGQWWLDAARRGGPKTLPVVNLNPEIVLRDENVAMETSD